jgi:FG-GAP repeat
MLHGISTRRLSVCRLLGLAFTYLLVIPTALLSPSILSTLAIVITQTAEAATIPKTDFNGDGYSDLAIGVRYEGIDDGSVGAVNVIYGSSDGLSGTELAAGNGRADQIWTQNSTDIEDDAEAGDDFGSAVATGDFNKDGYSDLAIGVPLEDVVDSSGTTVREAGAVNVIYGSQEGLRATALSPSNGRDDQIWTQNNRGIEEDAQLDDRFGWAVATGDFNKDGYSDLAIGVPLEDVDGFPRAGAVNVIYGSQAGLHPEPVSIGNTVSGRWGQIWTQNSMDILDDAQRDDTLGGSLAIGDFNKDGYSDLAIGAFQESLERTGGTITNAGAVNVIYGSLEGLSATGFAAGNGRYNQFWTQDSTDIEEDAQPGDFFGTSLEAGDFNKDGISDLAIGVAYEDVFTAGSIGDAGAVNVIYGSFGGFSIPHGGLRATVPLGGIGRDDQIWTQDSTDIDDNAEIDDSFGMKLATGDFNKDGFSDLAIAVGFERVGTVYAAGGVNVIYGSQEGLKATASTVGNVISGRTDQFWTQDSPNIEEQPEPADFFGTSLATGDFNKDGISDLAIGVLEEDVGTILGAGAVSVIYGSIGTTILSAGLSATVPTGGLGRADQIWTQNSTDIEDDVETFDFFGDSVA